MDHRREITLKELPEHPLQFLGINRCSQDAAPGAEMRHAGSSQRKEALQILSTQRSPFGDASAAGLSGQLRQHSDQQDLGQRIAHPTRMPTILDRSQVVVQGIQVEEQWMIGKRKGRGKCCNGHQKAFRVCEWVYFTSSYTRKALFYSRLCNSPGGGDTRLTCAYFE